MGSSLPNPIDVFALGTLAKSRYRIVEKIGSGGMAVVFLVHDEDLHGRPAVLKAPFAGPSFDPENLLARFDDEVASLIKLGHLDGVVDILDQGVQQGSPFYVASWMGGGNLHQRLGPEGTQSAEDAMQWLVPIAEALDGVNALHFVHRDVKPDNILFTDRDQARLADFGIARVFSGEPTGLTTGYTRIGTQAYWAPEQEAGIAIDGRADQFGLAASVYRALTGRPPATRGIAKRVREYAPEVTQASEQAIHRALETDRSDRFDTCAAFARAFADGMHEKPSRTHQKTRRVAARDAPAKKLPGKQARIHRKSAKKRRVAQRLAAEPKHPAARPPRKVTPPPQPSPSPSPSPASSAPVIPLDQTPASKLRMRRQLSRVRRGRRRTQSGETTGSSITANTQAGPRAFWIAVPLLLAVLAVVAHFAGLIPFTHSEPEAPPVDTRDRTPPKITITFPNTLVHETTGLDVIVAGSVDDPQATLVVDGVSQRPINRRFALHVLLRPLTAKTLEIRARDLAGNISDAVFVTVRNVR